MIVQPRAQESLGRPKSSRIQLCRKPPRIILEQGERANKDQQPRNARTRNWACKRGEPTRTHRRGTQGLGTWNAQDQQARNPRSRKFGRQKAAGHQGPTTAEPQAKESRAGKGSGPTFCAAGAKDSADLRTDMAPLGPCMDRPAWILASSTPEGTDPELWMQANRS